MSIVFFIKCGVEFLKEELYCLKIKDCLEVINVIVEVCVQGDLFENVEYEFVKECQVFIEGCIVDLEGKLGVVQIVDLVELNVEGCVVFVFIVDLENLDSGEKVIYQIVGLDEVDIKELKVLVILFIVCVLIGKSVGDVVVVEVFLGLKEYEILEVCYV